MYYSAHLKALFPLRTTGHDSTATKAVIHLSFSVGSVLKSSQKLQFCIECKLRIKLHQIAYTTLHQKLTVKVHRI